MDTGVVVTETFRLNDRKHRDEREGPAVIWRDPDGTLAAEDYFRYGRLHRKGGPARMELLGVGPENRTIVNEEYRIRGRDHRDPADGPAHIQRDVKTGIVESESYCVHGKFHRDPRQGPALIGRDIKTGRVTSERYYVNGKRHRDPEQGPAFITYNPKTGRPLQMAYFVDDQEVPAPPSSPSRSARKPRLKPPQP